MCSEYILESQRNGKYYIGSSQDINIRLEQHNSGRVKSTRSLRPLRLVYSEKHETRRSALKRGR